MDHDALVQRLARALQAYAAAGKPVQFRKASVSHLVPDPHRSSAGLAPLDLRGLDRVLHIDPETATCVAESGATFVDVVRAALPLGLVPPVVPELKGITVGGAVAGCSIESMSYRLGGFHDNCLEYEYITGRGDVRTCSPDHDAEVFHRLHGSYGTLGLITRVTFKLVPAKPFVRLEYRRFSDFAAFWAELRARIQAADFDFIDGIVHSPSLLVVCLGTFVPAAPYVSSYEWLDVYYKSTARRTEDYVTTPEYFFRYDAECHWMTRTVPLMETKPARFLIGKWLLGSTNLIRWSERLRTLLRLKRRPEVVVDVFIPARNFQAFFDWYVRVFDFFPLWIVPYALPTPYPWIDRSYARRMNDPLMIDCAIYGKPNGRADIDYSELLEREVHALDGLKTLISRNHYDETAFWSVFDRPGYERLKAALDPQNVFGTVFERFVRPRVGAPAPRG